VELIAYGIGKIVPIKSMRERVMIRCSQCESNQIYPMDTDDHECKCGAVYCGECDAEFSKEGELLAYGRVSL
jgi:hypothetical protein